MFQVNKLISVFLLNLKNLKMRDLIRNCLDPCDATGTKECVVTGNERLCVCNIGYWGDKCEQSGCNPDPCKNKAACEPVLAISADTNNFVCTCEDETYFMGETCNESRVINTARKHHLVASVFSTLNKVNVTSLIHV